MKVTIKTTRFGIIEIDEEKIIHMPFGMLGFSDAKRFVILQHREDSPFFWYQSMDDATLAFVITDPSFFMREYRVDVKDALEKMSWNEDKDKLEIGLYVVVNIPKGSPDKMTANLIGPLLINNRSRQAVQTVISDSPYSHNFPILRED